MTVTDRGLVIEGERTHETEDKDNDWFTTERTYGRFHRLVPLPDGIKKDEVKATFKDGVLEVTVPLPAPALTTSSATISVSNVAVTVVAEVSVATHTPVPAGHDAFPFHLVETHLSGAWGDLGGLREQFFALGHYDNGSGPMFNMTALALRTAQYVNGVSALHGEVTRTMWRPMWPETPADQIPVRSITNGVHVPTWISAEIRELFDRHLGADWIDRHDDPSQTGGADEQIRRRA